MDALYERPSNTVPPGEGDDGGASSGDEDMLDWTKLLFVDRKRPSLVTHAEIGRSTLVEAVQGSTSRNEARKTSNQRLDLVFRTIR